MGAFTIILLGLLRIMHTITAENVTRSFNFSPIPVSTKLIARTKVPLFMNSRGSYTVTKILDDANTTSDSLQSSASPVTLVTFPPFSKSYNYSTLAKTTAAAKASKISKIAKSLKSSPMVFISSSTTNNFKPTTSTIKPSSTTGKTVTVPKDLLKKNKLSMSKLAIMAATLTVDTTTAKASNITEQKKTTAKPKQTKPKKDKSKNPKNKHAKHQSTSPKPKNNKKKSARKSKGKTPKGKLNKRQRKNKNAKNGKRHARKYRQTDDFSGCHPYWNPKPNCDLQSTVKPAYRVRQKIVKRRVRSHTNNLALHAFNTLKKFNTYFKMF